ncbi:hypothetical protein [Streptomyces chumphonensis]|uniref:hypothetical protein n=1 Tax=Streptomyces chumphonensis TaxID=1214925 RepID=UPI003D73023B
MSLLDRGTESMTVYPAGPVRPDGTRGPAGEPVHFRCRAQPSAAASESSDGYAELVQYRLLARSLPAGPWDRVVWQGRDWTVVEQPAQWRGSRRVRHDSAVIRRR